MLRNRKTSSRGKILPTRNRATGRFLSGKGAPQILRTKNQTAAKTDPLRIFSHKKRNAQ